MACCFGLNLQGGEPTFLRLRLLSFPDLRLSTFSPCRGGRWSPLLPWAAPLLSPCSCFIAFVMPDWTHPENRLTGLHRFFLSRRILIDTSFTPSSACLLPGDVSLDGQWSHLDGYLYGRMHKFVFFCFYNSFPHIPLTRPLQFPKVAEPAFDAFFPQIGHQ